MKIKICGKKKIYNLYYSYVCRGFLYNTESRVSSSPVNKTRKGTAAGSILHRERPTLRCADRAVCCSMHLRGLRRGGTIGSNQGSQRGHGHGRSEAEAMVLYNGSAAT